MEKESEMDNLITRVFGYKNGSAVPMQVVEEIVGAATGSTFADLVVAANTTMEMEADIAAGLLQDAATKTEKAMDIYNTAVAAAKAELAPELNKANEMIAEAQEHDATATRISRALKYIVRT
jgi:hypothetical protein